VTRESAPAKLNLVLHVGPPDGALHPLCSLFASLELADDLELREAAADSVVCPGVEGDNLAAAALAALRERVPLPPLEVRIEKRIPVAAGLGGGSADAAAVLRAANRIAGGPLSADELRDLARGLGSDVPSQVEPRHALVTGTGELVEPVGLADAAVVLVPHAPGLSAREAYAELDRRRGWRERLDPGALRQLAARPLAELAAALENDLEPAALSLRPGAAAALAALREGGALGAAVSGSGPTAFGLFADAGAARAAAAAVPGAIVTRLRRG
jgi:4-diphosphocytidyl-2-C-methyl-D-erythritol kinase